MFHTNLAIFTILVLTITLYYRFLKARLYAQIRPEEKKPVKTDNEYPQWVYANGAILLGWDQAHIEPDYYAVIYKHPETEKEITAYKVHYTTLLIGPFESLKSEYGQKKRIDFEVKACYQTQYYLPRRACFLDNIMGAICILGIFLGYAPYFVICSIMDSAHSDLTLPNVYIFLMTILALYACGYNADNEYKWRGVPRYGRSINPPRLKDNPIPPDHEDPSGLWEDEREYSSYDASGLGTTTIRDRWGNDIGSLHRDGTITDSRGSTISRLK